MQQRTVPTAQNQPPICNSVIGHKLDSSPQSQKNRTSNQRYKEKARNSIDFFIDKSSSRNHQLGRHLTKSPSRAIEENPTLEMQSHTLRQTPVAKHGAKTVQQVYKLQKPINPSAKRSILKHLQKNLNDTQQQHRPQKSPPRLIDAHQSITS